jgi:hypothetical protein
MKLVDRTPTRLQRTDSDSGVDSVTGELGHPALDVGIGYLMA